MGMLATPVVGLVASSILVGEHLSAVDLLGFLMTLVGIATATLWQRGDRPASCEPEQS
jgi:drug/metabolite transporter (DMT)-like permease